MFVKSILFFKNALTKGKIWDIISKVGSETGVYGTEKYSSGRRGAPAKGVGRELPAREFKSLLLRQRKKDANRRPFFVGGESFGLMRRRAAQITEQSRVGKLACQRGGEGCSANVARSAT